MFLNHDLVELTDYRTTHTANRRPGSVSDVFNGKLYRDLCETPIRVDGQTFNHKYFEDSHYVVLGLSLDGFSIFNKRTVVAVRFSTVFNELTTLPRLQRH